MRPRTHVGRLGSLFALLMASIQAGCGGGSSDGPAIEPLSWASCGDVAEAPFECATVAVPLDHARRESPRIQLAVIRRPASNAAARLGAIFFNPGGPGGKGTDDLPGWIDKFPAPLRERFDLISWDPRGIGRSTAVRCFDSAAEERAFKSRMPQGYPVGDAQVQLQAQLQAEFNQGCAQHAGSLLEHVSTADTARDLEWLRQAANEPKMNYLGVSYGTLLGATYANLFPNRVRALVLDGNIDPIGYFNDDPLQGTSLRINNDIASAQTLEMFFQHCAVQGANRCAFAGADAAATAAKFESLIQRLAARPVELPEYAGVSFTEQMTESLVAAWLFVVLPTGDFPGWTALADVLEKLWQASAAPSASTSAAPPRQSAAAAANEAYDSDGGASAVQCGESPNPRSLPLFPEIAAFSASRAGRIGPAVAWFDAPCSSWPARSASVYTGPWNQPTPPILVIGNRYDPSTFYGSSVRMASLLSNARLLTVDGYGHTVLLNPSQCASDIQSAYFIDGTLPPEGTVCRQDKEPFDATESAP